MPQQFHHTFSIFEAYLNPFRMLANSIFPHLHFPYLFPLYQLEFLQVQENHLEHGIILKTVEVYILFVLKCIE